jgi:hypothetical protein
VRALGYFDQRRLEGAEVLSLISLLLAVVCAYARRSEGIERGCAPNDKSRGFFFNELTRA